MIATIFTDDEGPAVRLAAGRLREMGLRPGQRVRLDIRPLPLSSPGTPLMEPDGSLG